MEVFDEYGPQLTPEQYDTLRAWGVALALRLNYESERDLMRPRTLTDTRVSLEQLHFYYILEWDIQWPIRS